MLFQLVQVVYWAALSTWLGGVLFYAAATPVIFRTVKQMDPLLPEVKSKNLESEHAALLTWTIMGNLAAMLARTQWICSAVLLLGMIGQWLLTDVGSAGNLASALVRSALFVAAAGIMIYDSRFLWPRILKARQEFIDHADETDAAKAAHEQFGRYQQESITLMTILMGLLLGIVLFSGNFGHTTITLTTAPGK